LGRELFHWSGGDANQVIFLLGLNEIITKSKQYAIVVCPLESIIGDRIEEASSIGLTAKSLKDLTSHDLENGSF
jgi:hypothetical protein